MNKIGDKIECYIQGEYKEGVIVSKISSYITVDFGEGSLVVMPIRKKKIATNKYKNEWWKENKPGFLKLIYLKFVQFILDVFVEINKFWITKTFFYISVLFILMYWGCVIFGIK